MKNKSNIYKQFNIDNLFQQFIKFLKYIYVKTDLLFYKNILNIYLFLIFYFVNHLNENN